MRLLRKVVDATDPKVVFHWRVGQVVLDGAATISSIERDDHGWTYMYITNADNETVEWKSWSPSCPIRFENDLSFLS